MVEKYLFVLFTFCFCAYPVQSYASVEIDYPQIVVNLKPDAYLPSIVLNNVLGKFSEVTDVKVHFLNTSLELSLTDFGQKTWGARLSEEQLKRLLGTLKMVRHPALVTVLSRNAKGRIETKTENVEIVVQEPNQK